jgi:hypothetical protein
MNSGAFSYISIIIILFTSSLLFCQRNEGSIRIAKSNYIKAIESKLYLYPDKSSDLLKHNAARQGINNHDVINLDHYEISEKTLETFIQNRPSFFTQNIIVNNKKLKLAFEQVEIHSSDFRITTGDGKEIFPDTKQSLFYRGYIVGDVNSWATLSVSDSKLQYLIACDEGNFEIYQTEKGKYTSKLNKNDNKGHSCHSSSEISNIDHTLSNHHHSGTRTGNCLQVYMEVDRYTYLQFGTPSATTNWVNALFLNVSTIYAIHDVPVVLSQINIWNTQDPYASLTDISTVRNQFVNTLQNNYTGRIAHLLTTRPLGGGISNGIGGVCNSYPSYPGPQCVSSSLTSDNTIEQDYSYNAFVVAHEMGHVFGLRHTNACVWNNTLVQIDDCGNVYANNNQETPEGTSCYNVANPILPSGGGTIMSKCNLIAGVGINLNHGFGTIAGQLLYEKYIYANCSTGTSCNSLPNINDNCVDAINLPVTNSCSNYTFTNQNAMSSGLPAFSCGNSGTSKDVWFKVTVPSSGSVTIETSQTSGGLTDVIIQAYSGNCSSLTNIGCDDNSGAGNHALLILTGRTAGEVIFIRLVDFGSDNEGTFNICAYNNSVPCHPDFAALVSFYNATGGPSWINKTGWQNGAAGTNCNVCSWYGITCNELGRVSTINLPSNNLTGNNIPASLANISYLHTFKIYGNNLTGNLPSFFNSFGFLNTIDLGNNDFTGSIPSNLGSIPTLKNLYLDGNLLTGPLPSSLTAINLSLLYVNNNNLSGCIPSGYSIFCQKSFNFSNNPNLAGNISFNTYCTTGDGGDEDNDGYCRGLGDCNDNDNSVFPGNPELCDAKDNNCNGKIDDIANPVTNTWIASTGFWHTASNWSLGMVPQRCQNVVLSGTDGIRIIIESGQTAVARSVTIQTNKNLEVRPNSFLTIDHGLNLVNSGNITNNGTISIHNILDSALFGINNAGIIYNNSIGTISIGYSGVRSFSNNVTGSLTNSGTLIIDSYVNSGISTGFYNFGNVINAGNVTVRNISGNEIIIAPGSSFTNELNGVLSIED